jgi:processive 1,2-diacylglycerol beta-glucosyltransferase
VATRGPILIATVSVGAGHIRAAEAVREAITEADPAQQVDLVDVLNFGPAWARRLYREAFLRIAAISRRAAYNLYVHLDGEQPDAAAGHPERVIYHRFREFVALGGYSDIVCTHFLPCRVIEQDNRPALHLVVTDFALHRYWLQPNVDQFFVATESMAQTVRRRLPRVAAYATGIPVLASFRQYIDPLMVRRQFNIPAEAPVALVMGGGWGLGIEAMVRRALAASVRGGMHIIAVCGANQRAFRAVSQIDSPRLHAFAHVDDVARLMSAADLIISKPGGVTTSEALALHRPLLLARGVPGQEDRNAAELIRLGVAELVESHELARSIERFFSSRELRRQRFSALEQIGRNDAAAAIAGQLSPARVRCA